MNLFTPFFHDMDSFEIKRKKEMGIYLQKCLENTRISFPVMVSVSTGSGFLELLVLHSMPFFFKECIVIEMMNDSKKKSILSNFSNKCRWIDGETGCLSELHHQMVDWVFVGINMNFYNDWDFANEFLEFILRHKNTKYFFIWFPHMGKDSNDTCLISTNLNTIPYSFSFHHRHVRLDYFLNHFVAK